VRQIVAHCLEKDPANRFQSAKDLAFALSQTGTSTEAARLTAGPSSWRWRAVAVAAITVLVSVTKIYYDRQTDTEKLYSEPVLGWEEHLELENAWSPEALPDSSLLLARLNGERQSQWFRFWPDSGVWRHWCFSTLTFGAPSPRSQQGSGQQVKGHVLKEYDQL